MGTPSTLVGSMAGAYRCSWPVVIRVVRQPRGLIEAQNGGRRTRGNRGSAYSRWKIEVVAGFQRSTEQAVLAGSTFTGGNATVNHRRREGARRLRRGAGMPRKAATWSRDALGVEVQEAVGRRRTTARTK
jgi:hypothetical protein